MKKITSLLVTCLLAGGVIAQQSDDQNNPRHKKGKGKGSEEKTSGEAQPAAPAKAQAKQAPRVEKQQQRRAPEAPATQAPRKKEQRKEASAADRPGNGPKKRLAPPAENNVAKDNGEAAVARKRRGEEGNRGDNKRGKGDRAKAQGDNQNNDAAKTATGAAERGRNSEARPPDSQPEAVADQRQPRRNRNPRRPAPEKVQQIQAKHENFRAEPRPDRVPSVTFNESRRIENSDRWQGPQYEVFRSYRPERHDETYYRSHYDRVELFGGGYYYQQNNYWYPAWGYQPSNEYYAYDGPIYAGRRAAPPDRVIADVQDSLQDLGYYKGEVDGLLGPLTREALSGYQSEEGLEPTAAIDEPTLDALGLQ